MIKLWQEKEKIKRLVKKTDKLLLLLDYDGTIVPIKPTPKEALLPITTRNLLKNLCSKPQINLGIISGRSLEDIKEKVGIPGIIYSGNHGLEWEMEGKRYRKFHTGGFITNLKKKLKILEKKFGNVFIEDKELILSVHYRLLDKQYVPVFRKYLKNLINPYLDNQTIILSSGKKVYEVRPNVDWNKGKFIEYMVDCELSDKRNRLMIIYVGDDTTDEDVFSRLDDAITVKVGKGKSKAKYYLKNPYETVLFLEWLSKNLK